LTSDAIHSGGSLPVARLVNHRKLGRKKVYSTNMMLKTSARTWSPSPAALAP
jgi:hypothetical protein